MQLTTYFIKPVFVAALAAITGLPLAAQQPASDTTRPAGDAIQDTSIIVISKPGQLPDSLAIKVSGLITDAATRKPLPGIGVSVPSFSAAITDENGRFTIKVPSLSATLQVTASGFQSKEIPLRGNTEVSTQLFDDNFDSWYDPVVLPTGTKSKNQVPASFTTASAQGGWTRNLETPDNFLQGMANGLNVVRRSGTPNSGSSLFMRGMTSLYATNQPLIVIDGMIYENNDFGGSIISGHHTNPLSLVDIKDIDNITVLKDGSSLYGTKGANGVIIITTAKARDLATRIDFSIFSGINFAPDRIPLMNPTQYRPYLADVLQSQGLTYDQIQQQPYMYDDMKSPEYYRYHYNTNWQDEVFQNGLSQNVYLRVTGGDNIARYALSMGYLSNGGIIKNTDVKRYNTRFNADLNLSKKLTVNANLSFAYSEQNTQQLGISRKLNPIYVALVKAPFLPVHEVDDKGVVSPNLADADTLGVSNPATIVQNVLAINKTYRFFGSLNFTYSVNPHMSISSLFGLTQDKVRENFFIPRKGIVNDTLQADVADSRSGSQAKRLFAVFSDTRISYNRIFNRVHAIEAQAAIRFQQQMQEQDLGLGYNSATDELINVGYSVASLRRVGGDIGKNRWLNTSLSVQYGYNSKLFLNVAVAADGSSRFGTNIPGALTINQNKYSLLPSVSAAWLISSEKFMSHIQALSFLKLRAGYSFTGNSDIGNFTARQYYVSQNLLGMQGLVRGNIANPQLQWEVVKKGNLSLDAGLLQDKLRLSVDVYDNRTDKMVILEDAPVVSGFDYMATNSGAMKTSGIEVNVSSRVINRPLLKWDVSAGIAAWKNTITRLPGERIITNYADATLLTETGKAANLFYGYKTRGVYSSDAEAAAAGLTTKLPDGSWAPFTGGDIIFEDVNDDHRIDELDRQVIGDPNPDFTGLFSTSLTWRRFTFEALITASVGNDIYNYTRARLESGSDYSNQLPVMVNRWRTQGQITHVPKAAWGDPMGNSRFSDRWIEDGSYIRVRTIGLTYKVPVKPGFLKYITVYTSATNLFTFSKYLGYDPEFSSTESVLGQGVDIGLAPQYKSVQAGVRIGL